MTIINHECYVSLEVAKLLKEAGFDWECDYHYADNTLCHGFCNNDPMFKIIISAPTLDIAQRWLREVKHLEVYAMRDNFDSGFYYFAEMPDSEFLNRHWIECDDYSETYEEALEAGIKKALEIILEKGE